MYALQVERCDEFSPLKNSREAPTDNSDTCRKHMSELHKKWIRQAGGELENGTTRFSTFLTPLDTAENFCEISPLVSYGGEGLEPYAKGKKFPLPYQFK